MSRKLFRTILVLLFAIALCAPTTLLAALNININSATVEQLQQINGIGPKTAEKIVEYRNTHGKFSSLDELRNIRGIGDKSLEKMANSITIE
ncbi:MAG: helix-hairpin-helix domain-containing protein [Desulfuromonadaceae bacterium]|nr:helix-hairpin-helix domain-containing protein [Desulfuromonadaceae bacterium]